MMKKFILALISMSLLLASGCAHIEEYDTEETADTEETTEVQTVTVDNPEYYTRFKNDGISINVYNWGEYIPDGSEEGVLNLNAEFTKLTGITVNYSTYATNEELYAKLKGGGSTYDIIIPSDYMISRMIKENMLENYEVTKKFMSYIDVLVDGEFKLELKDLNLVFRGSSNQRIIMVKESLESGNIILWKEPER
mgnify:FL=1